MLSFNFILPFSGRKPVGGFKVVYEYANELVKRGFEVTITHTAGLYLGVNPNDLTHLNLAKFIAFGLLQNYTPDNWFSLDKRVRTRWVPCLYKSFISKADFVMATSWETAEWVSKLPAEKGRKAYLIQHMEDWHASRDRVLNTWKAIKTKVVISSWLQEIAQDIGEKAFYVPNGLDFSVFGVDRRPEDRNPASVLMLYHDMPFKGTKFGLDALSEARRKIPGLTATLFGAIHPPSNLLPSWVNFEFQPTQSRLRELYNECAIFISPSLAEGWALPPAEAMQCGCATVLTKIGGHEYAIDGLTSLLSEPNNAREMSFNIVKLIKDPTLRTSMAWKGNQVISHFTWEIATDRLLQAITEAPRD